MTNTPRSIKAYNLTVGTWYPSNEIVPPDDRQVLCCDREKTLWFANYDTDEKEWSQRNYDSDQFFWQEVAKPLDCLFD